MLTGIFVGSAQAETALDICNAEAKDAGIEDPIDFRAYVDECVEQVSADLERDTENGIREDNEDQSLAEAQ